MDNVELLFGLKLTIDIYPKQRITKDGTTLPHPHFLQDIELN